MNFLHVLVAMPSTFTVAIYYYFSASSMLILNSTVPQRVGWSLQ